MADANTKLLLHLNGEDEAQETVDSSQYEHVVTFLNQAQLDTSEKWQGLSSLLLDGTGDGITVAHSVHWAFGSGNFTLEGRLRFTALPTPGNVAALMYHWNASGSFSFAWTIYNDAGNYKFKFNISTTGANSNNFFSDALTLAVDTWYHFAVVRYGNSLLFFLEGVAKGTGDVTGLTLYDSAEPLTIGIHGNQSDYPLNGRFDEIRVSNVARWTESFTPQTTEYMQTYAAAITESASASETEDRTKIHTAAITESASAGEVEDSLRILTAAIIESATAEDEESCIGIFNAAITEIVSATDTIDSSGIYLVEITETAEATEAEDASTVSAAEIVEAANATSVQDRCLFYTEIPPFMQKDLIDPYSGGAWLWLCEFAMPGQAKIRIARNTENISYENENFEKFNFQIGEQVFSGDGSIPRVTLQIFQDLNRKMENIVNETEGALGAAVKLIRVNEKFLDTPVAALEADYENLASESNTEWVTFTLGVPNPLTQRFPLRLDSYSGCPWATPSLFKGPRCQYTGSDTSCTGTFNDCYLKGNAVHWGAELGLDPNVVRV